MAVKDPSYFETTPLMQEIQQKEVRFHLYLFQEGATQRVVMEPGQSNNFGTMAVQDWAIRDAPSFKGNIVARAQGLHMGACMAETNWFICFNIVFTDDRFVYVFQTCLH